MTIRDLLQPKKRLAEERERARIEMTEAYVGQKGTIVKEIRPGAYEIKLDTGMMIVAGPASFTRKSK